MSRNIPLRVVAVTAWLAALFFLSGCASTGDMWPTDGGFAEETSPASMQYAAVDFQDIQIPNELEWSRPESLSVRTESFVGGTLKFTGRVEVNSLTDFFINTMPENGWKLVGVVRYENVLMVFTKPNKTCTISIYDARYTGHVAVYINATDDIAARLGPGTGIGEEVFLK